MRAVVQETFGGPEVLQIKDVPSPSALPTELVVRVKAVRINAVEVYIRSGRFPLIGQPPFILGWDISGALEQIALQISGDESEGQGRSDGGER
jgi:NADPH:quinone reductase-like Zn-dependent oxidoreductase